MRNDTLILFYSDNGTDSRITSRFDGGQVRGGKATTAQSGIRVPLIANWPGHIAPGVNSDLVEASDFVPTLAGLAGKNLPDRWQTDGVSFGTTAAGNEGITAQLARSSGTIRAPDGTRTGFRARYLHSTTATSCFQTVACSTLPGIGCAKCPWIYRS